MCLCGEAASVTNPSSQADRDKDNAATRCESRDLASCSPPSVASNRQEKNSSHKRRGKKNTGPMKPPAQPHMTVPSQGRQARRFGGQTTRENATGKKKRVCTGKTFFQKVDSFVVCAQALRHLQKLAEQVGAIPKRTHAGQGKKNQQVDEVKRKKK